MRRDAARERPGTASKRASSKVVAVWGVRARVRAGVVDALRWNEHVSDVLGCTQRLRRARLLLHEFRVTGMLRCSKSGRACNCGGSASVPYLYMCLSTRAMTRRRRVYHQHPELDGRPRISSRAVWGAKTDVCPSSCASTLRCTTCADRIRARARCQRERKPYPLLDRRELVGPHPVHVPPAVPRREPHAVCLPARARAGYRSVMGTTSRARGRRCGRRTARVAKRARGARRFRIWKRHRSRGFLDRESQRRRWTRRSTRRTRSRS